MTVTITGASGFVGRRLVEACVSAHVDCQSASLRGWNRSESMELPNGHVLVHLSAIAHSDDPDEAQLYAVNRDLSVVTAELARERGYRQFVFLSSALVWGAGYESVDLSTPALPDTAYGRAKLEAEEALQRLDTPEFGITILRPPLIYGPGVKGNLKKLLRAVYRWPVCPLGVSENRRSLLHVDNLSASIIHLARSGARGTFCPVDNPPVSTLELLKRMAAPMPRHGRVLSMPQGVQWFLRHAAPRSARRLFGSFVVTDDSLDRAGFVPQFTIDDGFEKMVSTYLHDMTRCNHC